jgi:hypothetical protein
MCVILDVVYLGCGCMLDRIVWLPCRLLPGEAHDFHRNTQKEFVVEMCPTCIKITGLTKEYKEGRLEFKEYEAQLAELKKGMVKAPEQDLRVGRR